MSTMKSSCSVAVADLPKEAKDQIAERLSRLTGGTITITFDHDTSMDHDPDSMGHLFGGLLIDTEEECLWLDDRSDIPLELQLVYELRRVGKLYKRIAKEVQQAIS